MLLAPQAVMSDHEKLTVLCNTLLPNVPVHLLEREMSSRARKFISFSTNRVVVTDRKSVV